MLANIYLNAELDPESNPPLVPERMAQIDVMGLEFDGDNPVEPETWVDTEDIQAEEIEVDPNLDLYNPQFGKICNMLAGKLRKEQQDLYFQGIDAMRAHLREVISREELYAIATFAADLDRAMEASNEWREGWDAMTRLEEEFNRAQRDVMRLEAIAAEQARLDTYARTVLIHQEQLRRDNARVSA